MEFDYQQPTIGIGGLIAFPDYVVAQQPLDPDDIRPITQLIGNVQNSLAIQGTTVQPFYDGPIP